MYNSRTIIPQANIINKCYHSHANSSFRYNYPKSRKRWWNSRRNTYRKDDAERPEILEKEPESVPLWALPEVGLQARKLRHRGAVHTNNDASILKLNISAVLSNLSRPLLLIFFIFFGGGDGAGVAPPVLAVEASGSGGELLGSRDDVESSEWSSSDSAAACWGREGDAVATVLWVCSGIGVEDSAASAAASSVRYGEGHEWMRAACATDQLWMRWRKKILCLLIDPMRFSRTRRLGLAQYPSRYFNYFSDKFKTRDPSGDIWTLYIS